MPRNTTSSIDSNIIQTVTTTTAAHMVARIRTGIGIFQLPDAQFAEHIGHGYLDCTLAEAVYQKKKEFQSSQRDS